MLTSLRKYMLQKEGYAAREDGIACPYEDHSDEWYHWQTGWLMHRYEEGETSSDISGRDFLASSPPVDDTEAAQDFICPECKTPVRLSLPAARPDTPPVQQFRRAASHARYR